MMKKCIKTDVNPFSAPWTRELFPNCALGALILLVLAICNHNYAVTFASDTQNIPLQNEKPMWINKKGKQAFSA